MTWPSAAWLRHGITRRGKGLCELPSAGVDGDMHSMLRSGLTWDEKDRLLPTVAVADDNLHDNGSIEAPAEHYRD